MKKILLLSAFILSTACAFSQNIAINTTGLPAATSAILDVSSGSLGLLIPRVVLTNTGTYLPLTGAAADGLIVYNSNAAIAGTGAAGIGFYYWNIALTRWVNLLDNLSPGSAWMLAGNSATNPANDFVGTFDAQDLVFRTTNVERARILSGGNILFNRTTALFATDLFEAQGNATFPDAINGYTGIVGGIAIFGQNTVGGASSSIFGLISSATGFGIDGFNQNASGTGIIGVGNNIGGSYLAGGSGGAFTSTNVGVAGFGNNTAFSYGVYGTTANATGTGVYGYNGIAGATVGFGMFGQTAATGGSAVAAYNGAGAASYFAGTAVSGIAISTLAGGVGVMGDGSNATGRGVSGQSSGASGYGVYGVNNTASVVGAPVFGGHALGGIGTNFNIGNVRAAIKGAGQVAGSYGFGVFGSGGTSLRSGGVIGNNYFTSGTACGAVTDAGAGALGYWSAGDIGYGVYGFGCAYAADVSTGKMSSGSGEEMSLGSGNNFVGLGIYGGVMGGWIRGLAYGANIKGSNKYYSLYVDGKTYTNNVITQLETTENGRERIATYVSTSLSVDITERGTASLQNGKTFVPFIGDFKELVSEKEPIMVTATPNSSSNGIFISSVTKEGFYVLENNNGTSSVPFTWIAVGTKKGQEAPQHAAELMSLDFDNTMTGVMFNDGNAEENGTTIWWDGTKVRHDARPLVEKPSYFTEMAPVKIQEHRKNIDVITATTPKNR